MAFNNWPYTNFQDLNLGWILSTYKTALNKALEALGKANAVEAEVGTYSDRIATAETTANGAYSIANMAREEAADAQSDATSGIAIGQAAQSTANSALSAANAAADSADEAVDSATDAARDAATALQLANLASEDYLNVGITVFPSNPAQATKNADEILTAVTANKKIKFTLDDARNGETHTTYDYTIDPVDNTASDIDINVIFDVSVSSSLNKYIVVTLHKVVSGGNTTYSITSTDVSFSGGGGGTVSGAVLYDTQQNLTDVQKAQARDNIGADSRPLILNVTYSNGVYTVDKTAAEIRANMHNLLLTFGLNEGVTIDSYQIYGSPPKHYIVFSVADPDTSSVTYIEYTVSVYFTGYAPTEQDDVPTVTRRVIQHNIGGGSLPDATDASAGDYLKLDSNKNAVWDELPLFAPPIVDTATGDPASITDGADHYPLKSLIANIEPVQSGSGDPSPSNVRPITGFTECKVTRTGKNLLPNVQERTVTTNGVTFTKNDDGSISLSGAVNSGLAYYNIDFVGNVKAFDLVPLRGKEVCVSISEEAVAGIYIKFTYFKEDGTNVNILSTSTNASTTIPNDAYRGRTFVSVAEGTILDGVTLYPQIELGTTASAYEPYQSYTDDIMLPSEAGTVYGGTLDVTNGVLNVTKGFIASYNGETLPGEWISSMDVYTQGSSPTTGAQVCYELANPITYHLDSVIFYSSLGENVFFADSGAVSVEYYADTKLYIQKLVATNANNRTSVTEVKEKPEIVLKETESEEKSKETPDEEITEETEP